MVNFDIVSASQAEVAKHLNLDKSAVSRRVSQAVDLEFLVNREMKRGLPARLVSGDPLPGDVVVLPLPEDLGEEN